MKYALAWVTFITLLTTAQVDAQCAGSPSFTCDDGSPSCVDCQYTCNGAPECPLPPPEYPICQDGQYEECTGSGWQCLNNGGSPIIIDTKGEGYHLTNIQDGVLFRFFPDRPPVDMSWTNSSYSNGFLAMDRNGNGLIDNGSELFGTETPQPASGKPNGFKALAVYDLPLKGGNNNGVIDPGDAVWSKLLVWIDANHDGVSQPRELHKLSEFGIVQLDLAYRLNRYVDPFGNQFRYESDLNDSLGRKPERIYDVILLLKLNQGPATSTYPHRTEGQLAPSMAFSGKLNEFSHAAACKLLKARAVPFTINSGR